MECTREQRHFQLNGSELISNTDITCVYPSVLSQNGRRNSSFFYKQNSPKSDIKNSSFSTQSSHLISYESISNQSYFVFRFYTISRAISRLTVSYSYTDLTLKLVKVRAVRCSTFSNNKSRAKITPKFKITGKHKLYNI